MRFFCPKEVQVNQKDISQKREKDIYLWGNPSFWNLLKILKMVILGSRKVNLKQKKFNIIEKFGSVNKNKIKLKEISYEINQVSYCAHIPTNRFRY